jgi:primosomal protein N' (replication factor Y)
VATSKLFRLKAEVASTPPGPQAIELGYVRARVDTGVFHLDELYDYIVPEKFSDSAKIGVRIQVPFGSREVEAIIVERVGKPERAGALKFITKVLSPHPIATVSSLKLIDQIARDYASNSWDVIRSAIPSRVAAVDKRILSNVLAPQSEKLDDQRKDVSQKVHSRFIQLAAVIPAARQVASIATTAFERGNVLIVAPDEKDVDQILRELAGHKNTVLKLTASMSREERYENFLSCLIKGKKIVVGTRSSIFAPVDGLATIIIYKESSPEHFEIRSPGWNSKDVAKRRAKMEKLEIVSLGYCPSIEIAHLIEAGEVLFEGHQSSVSVAAFNPDSGTLLPGRIFPEIRKALLSGPVLFLAARKGYGNALLCSHCRNVALCECGGRLQVGAKSKPPMCVHCGKNYIQWRCNFCKGTAQYLAGRGIERASEEISRAFPGFPVLISSGDVIKESIDPKPSLILATPGAQPRVSGGYSAVVVLDATRFFSHTDIRTQERAREILFETSALISEKGKVLLIIDEVHPIVSALTRWNVVPILKRELAERREINQPPYVASTLMIMGEAEGVAISAGLKRAVSDHRLPQSIQVFGPTPVAKEQSKIVIFCEHRDAEKLQRFLHEFQKKRSVARKDLITMRLEPYSL